VNYNEWCLLYFISFLLLVGFFVLNMFVGVVVENFHKCQESQEKEEKVRQTALRASAMERRRRSMMLLTLFHRQTLSVSVAMCINVCLSCR
jgi:hypothetical protein